MGVSFWKRAYQAITGIGKGQYWEETWNSRMAALETILGPSADQVYHSPTPFYLGGDADLVVFRNYIDGVTYVTADLTGENSDQISNSISKYELMICTRGDADWAPYVLAKLSRYTLEAVLEPGHSMDFGILEGSSIAALLLALPEPFYMFDVLGHDASLLVCIGITEDELAFHRDHGGEELLTLLKEAKVFPFTDPDRESVLEK